MSAQPTASTPNNSRIVLLAMLALAVVGLLAAGVYSLIGANAEPEPKPMIEGVTAVDPPLETTEFTLVSADGVDVSLSDLRGKMTLLFFGYTHCPDFCPTTLDEFKRIRTLLGEDADDAQFVFISVDGERDTVERMADYLQIRGVDDFVIGLTGDEAVVQAAAQPFGVFFERNRTTTTASAYLVDHSTQSFLLDRDGKLRAVYSYTAPPDVIADHIRPYLT